MYFIYIQLFSNFPIGPNTYFFVFCNNHAAHMRNPLQNCNIAPRRKSADLFQSVERVGLQAIIPVFQPSQPSQARQASQPGQPGIEASGLQASMSAILSIGVPTRPFSCPQGGTGRHRAAQGGTGGIAFCPSADLFRASSVGEYR